jgi:hypothetical protein
MLKRSLFTLLAATALSTSVLVAVVTPAAAQINVTIGAPPPVQYEVVPQSRSGQTWTPGYWNYENNQHVWAPGRYVDSREGHHYVPDRWVKYDDRGHENWKREGGRWERN